MREEQETLLAPPCAHADCGLLPAAHAGWALGHLYQDPQPEADPAPEQATTAVDWETEGSRILAEAYERWRGMPALRLRISRVDAYLFLAGLQMLSAHPDPAPYVTDAWETMARQLTEMLVDGPEIAGLIEAGWHRENDVPAETERQPTTADATVHPDMVQLVTRDSGGVPPQARTTVDTIDVTAPYCYRIDQTDRTENRPDEDFMISWGSAKKSPHWSIKNALDVATYQAAVSRIEHNYLGPLRVSVWQQRPDEHYRQDPPEDAFLLELGERDDLSMAHTLVAGINQDS